MATLTMTLRTHGSAYSQAIQRLAEQSGKNARTIAKELAASTGYTFESAETMWYEHRVGKRRISEDLLGPLAQALGTTESELLAVNSLYQDELRLEFDPKINIKDFLSPPDGIDTLDAYLLWLSSECTRKERMRGQSIAESIERQDVLPAAPQ